MLPRWPARKSGGPARSIQAGASLPAAIRALSRAKEKTKLINHEHRKRQKQN